MAFAGHTKQRKSLSFSIPVAARTLILYVVAAVWLVTTTEASSVGRRAPLTTVSGVDRVGALTSDGLVDLAADTTVLEVEIPENRHYSNLKRRWWAVSDPNNAHVLHHYRDAGAVRDQAFYEYLTYNGTAPEVPQDSTVFRFVLSANRELYGDEGVRITTTNADGEVVVLNQSGEAGGLGVQAYKGRAYRRTSHLSPTTGDVVHRFRPVGWARLTVSQTPGPDGATAQTVQGTWKVDDVEGLGVPPSVYHLQKRATWAADVGRSFDEERDLLDSVAGYDSVVWRDFDMRLGSGASSLADFADDDFSYLSKRSVDLPKQYLTDNLYDDVIRNKRDVATGNDTSGSGFSSGENLYETIGDTAGCPSPRQVALVGIAADCTYISLFDNASAVNAHIIDVVNSASHVFETGFNISLGLKEIFLPNVTSCTNNTGEADPQWNVGCGSGASIGSRLSLFSAWRGARRGDGLATWSLMTACSDGSVVGLSWLGMACSPGDGTGSVSSANESVVADTNVVSHTSLDWRVLAHELGHSFGAVHDCDSSTCAAGDDQSSQCCPLAQGTCDADGRYIMNPVSSESQDEFSPCTQGNVCNALGRNAVNGTCLTSNQNLTLLTENECGNGIVEEGEDCDCGGPEGCGDNSCCDPNTCRFTEGSQCDDANEVCCQNCQFAASTVVCRSSQGPCDPAEYCPGNSSACPSDIKADNGQNCTDPDHPDLTNLECMSGQCTSRDLQCFTLLGNSSLTANGQTLNVTRACDDDSSCQLSCVDPRFGSTCFTTSQNFLDGTPCRGTGTCRSGRCVGGRDPNAPFIPSGPLSSWFDDHRTIIIAVVASVGGVILLAVLYMWLRGFMAHRRLVNSYAARRNKPAPPPPPPMRAPPYSPPPPAGGAPPPYNGVPPSSQSWNAADQAQYLPPFTSNQPIYAPPPPPPSRFR